MVDDLTKMVNNPNLRTLVTGQYETVTSKKDGRIRVRNGPIYNLELAKKLLNEHGFIPVNENVETGLSEFSPPWDESDIPLVINALRADLWIESEICRFTTRGIPVDCDAYRIRWNKFRRMEWQHASPAYIKFGFKENHPKCLIVSAHPAY